MYNKINTNTTYIAGVESSWVVSTDLMRKFLAGIKSIYTIAGIYTL